MDISKWSSIIVAAIGAGVVLWQQRRRPERRAAIKTDLDIYSALPPESGQRDPFLKHIDNRLEQLIASEKRGELEWSDVTLALFLIGAGVAVTWLSIDAGGLWQLFLIAAALLVLTGVVGLGEARKKPANPPATPRVVKTSAKKTT